MKRTGPLEYALLDPSDNLSPEVFVELLSFLDHVTLCTCNLVSRQWYQLATTNWLWTRLCRRLWQDKQHVPQKCLDMSQDGHSAKKAFFESLKDSQRCWLTADELCKFEWNFRFKSVAGPNWIDWDQWWNNKPATRVTFYPDGIMKRDPEPPYPTQDFRWTFVDQSCGKKGPLGSFVSINDFPKYHVSRYKNWGFLMQSCWAFFTSFPMPPMGANKELEDENLDLLNVTFDMQRSEALSYNTGLPMWLHEDQPVALDLQNVPEDNQNLLLGFLRYIARAGVIDDDGSEEEEDDNHPLDEDESDE